MQLLPTFEEKSGFCFENMSFLLANAFDFLQESESKEIYDRILFGASWPEDRRSQLDTHIRKVLKKEGTCLVSPLIWLQLDETLTCCQSTGPHQQQSCRNMQR